MLWYEGEIFYVLDGLCIDLFFFQCYDVFWQVIIIEYFVDMMVLDGVLCWVYYMLMQCYYMCFEMEWLLCCVGFEVLCVIGSFQGGLLVEMSEVMVFQVRGV